MTLTRLFVRGAPPGDLRRRYLQAIRLRAFTPLDPEGESAEASGWCVMERPFDLEFDAAKVFEDRFVVLGFRIDRYRIPAALIRAQLLEDEARILAKTGKNRVSRNERLELRDKIVLKLRKRFPPSTRAVDLVWDLDAGTVLFFTHAKRTIADACALFEKTFGLELDEDSPYLAVSRCQLPERIARKVAKVAPLSLGPAARKQASAEPAARSEEPDPDSDATGEGERDELFERIETTRFLGPEFLLWIWLRNEFSKQALQLDDAGSEFHVWLDRTLTFESALDRHERVTIAGAAPADGEEARAAVRAHKFPVRSRIVMQSPEREYALVLVAQRLQIASARLPAVIAGDSDEAFLERMALAEGLFSALDRLYGLFLRDRLGEPWTGWERAIASWLEGESVPAAVLQKLAGQKVTPRSPPHAARGRGRARAEAGSD